MGFWIQGIGLLVMGFVPYEFEDFMFRTFDFLLVVTDWSLYAAGSRLVWGRTTINCILSHILQSRGFLMRSPPSNRPGRWKTKLQTYCRPPSPELTSNTWRRGFYPSYFGYLHTAAAAANTSARSVRVMRPGVGSWVYADGITARAPGRPRPINSSCYRTTHGRRRSARRSTQCLESSLFFLTSWHASLTVRLMRAVFLQLSGCRTVLRAGLGDCLSRMDGTKRLWVSLERHPCPSCFTREMGTVGHSNHSSRSALELARRERT